MNLFALSKPKIVINESKTKDPELYKYTLHSQEIKMTPELLQSISDGIEEDRKLHIENYLREFGFKEFNGKQSDLVLKTPKLF